VQRPASFELDRAELLPAALDALGLETRRPVLVVVGGASGLSEELVLECAACADELVAAAVATGAAIVDGGTDSGVMRLLGRAHARAGAGVPLVGVIVRALAALPGEPAGDDAAPPEPNHTHLLLVPGSSWGDEAPWIALVASTIAEAHPSVTVLLNGGEIAWTDAAESVADGRPVLALAGSGRTADELAAAASGGPADERAAALVCTGLVEAVPLGEDARPSLQERVEVILRSERHDDGR
jgi:hypothetical protein